MTSKTEEPLLCDAEEIHQEDSSPQQAEEEEKDSGSDAEPAEFFGFQEESPPPTLLELSKKVSEAEKKSTVADILMRHIAKEREKAGFDWIVAEMRRKATERYGESSQSDSGNCDR